MSPDDDSQTTRDFGVAVKPGLAATAGHVGSHPEKLAAQQAAFRVRGVKGVVEEIELCLPFERWHDDGDIAAAAFGRLAWHAALPPSRFTGAASAGLNATNDNAVT